MTAVGADAWLVDDRWSKAYPLIAETNIGRGPGSSIILRDPVISRRHACVVREANGYVLHSYGAAGTTVNGVAVQDRHMLREGDVIAIAFTSLRFTMMAPTGEMFIIARDAPTLIDQLEGPTRATLRGVPITLPFWRRQPVAVIAALLALALLAFFLLSGSGNQ